MDLLLDILQGAGLAAAAGISPIAATLAAGALAAGDLGLDFDYTRASFLESPGVLAALAAALLCEALLGGRAGGRRWTPALATLTALGGLVAGAVLFAGSLGDRHDFAWPGVVAGPPIAWLGVIAARGIVEGAAKRAKGTPAAAIELAVAAAAAIAAALVIAAPPVTLVLVAFLARLAVGARRRGGERYAGLRVLR